MDMLLRIWFTLVLLLLPRLGSGAALEEQTTEQPVAWFTGGAWSPDTSLSAHLDTLTLQERFSLIGGSQVSLLKFSISQADDYVIDFRNSNLVGEFQHVLFDRHDRPIVVRWGGLSRHESPRYFLRNGIDVFLTAGDYTLVTYQQSQFNIAPPTPFVMPQLEYVEQLKVGNSITLMGLGILLALFFYYLVLSVARLNLIDLSYALFILGNLLFNATSLLVAEQLLQIRWFGGASWPILFSNIAYLVFVMSLLKVRFKTNPWLWSGGATLIALFSLFVVLSVWLPHLQNEFNRASVGIFLFYGLVAGVRKSWQGSAIARLYLVANLGFVLLGAIAISQEQIQGLQTVYMSHIGLLAVACEVLLLSFVVAYQMLMLESEKTRALQQAQEVLTLAQTDTLTQLPNRYAMEERLLDVDAQSSFVYIDLDGLKYCNDHYGHEVGDKFLTSFSHKLRLQLPHYSQLYRISGDEFGIIFRNDTERQVIDALQQVERELQQELGTNVGVSFGSAKFAEHAQHQQAIQAADEKMYSSKKRKKAVA